MAAKLLAPETGRCWAKKGAQPPTPGIGRGMPTKAQPPATKTGRGRFIAAEPPAAKSGRGGAKKGAQRLTRDPVRRTAL